MWRVLLLLLPLLGWVLIAGCSELRGPPAVHGYTGSSLSVTCHYEKSYRRYTKFWCKNSQYTSMCSQGSLIASDSDKRVEKGRVSIEDKRSYSFFKVTMDNLQLYDAGTYQCGIERYWDNIRLDVIVNVIVSNTAPTPAPEEKSVTPETTDPNLAKNTATDVMSPKVEPHKPKHILMYCLVGVFSLLLFAIVVLVVMSRRKRRGLGLWRKKETKPSNTGTVDSTVVAPAENLVPDHPTSTNGMGLYSNVEISPESNGERTHTQRKAVGKRNEVTYAMLTISDLQQEAIYANVDPTPSPGPPQTPTQDVFYTEVKKSLKG